VPLLQELSNVRLFVVRDRTGYYSRRVIAAEEAIGDIIAIASVEEGPSLDLLAMIEQAAARQCVVLAVRPWSHALQKLIAAPLVALGRAAGFKISPRDLKTCAYPRTHLNLLLAHPDPELALRFPPRDPRIPLALVVAEQSIRYHRRTGDVWRRLQLLQRLLIYLAPKLLVLVSFSSTLLALLGVGYALYAVGAWLLLESLAPGWLTTSAMLSLTAIFLGTSILGISLGLQQVLRQQRRDDTESLAQEINRIDIFSQVSSELNVDQDRPGKLSLTDSD
jgi:hypothetical protein